MMLTAILASTTASAAAADPRMLQRTGEWVADYDRDACRLIAQFGAGEDAVTLRFSRYEPGDKFDLVAVGRRLPADGSHYEATVDFGLADKPVETFSLNGAVGDRKALIFSGQRVDGWRPKKWDDPPPPITTVQEGKVIGVTLAVEARRPTYRLRLEFGPLAKPFAQLRNCTWELVRRWGYDPEVQATLSRRVTPATKPQSWVSDQDFPASASAAGQIGTVQFRMDVGSDGQILGCYVLDRTEPDVFGDLTCKLLTRRSKFHAALDAQGRPVRSYFVHKISWMIRG